jgi:hypothetical protein
MPERSICVRRLGALKTAAAGPVPDELSIDSGHAKAHRSAAGSKRGSSPQRLAVRAAEERAKSMLWPMIAADRSLLRWPRETSPTSPWPLPCFGAVAGPKRLLADKAYDADSLRKWLKQRKVKAVVPSTASRWTPYPLDSDTYKRRNLIEPCSASSGLATHRNQI